ncbi:rod shape-determining protein [Anaerosporobacter faecicola]|uniref:rod shape-determining protein n=1 Tax=Anaerosporobacter faecicola TaxID=2718714 RepID=UPI00143C28EE|nr:rod shape-determining protein [Anaerosporobacter faecicola]
MAAKTYGIDLGTNTIKVYKKGEGVVLHERNIIAIENKKNVLAVGDEAYEMNEKAPVSIKVISPVRNGVIADIGNMQRLLTYTINKLNGGKKSTSSFFIAVPTDITAVEKKSFYDTVLASNSKIKDISIVEKSIADALGVGLDITNARGVMVVNIGADTTEVSIISLGGIVLSKLINIGGNKLDESIKLYVKKKYNLAIGSKTAETIKKNLTFALPGSNESISVFGRNVVNGLPAQMEINSEMVYDSIREYLHTIVDAIKVILERTPPEISSDIIESGIYVTGGSATIKGLDRLIAENTDLKVNICDKADSTVVEGLGRIIEEPDLKELATNVKQIINRR